MADLTHCTKPGGVMAALDLPPLPDKLREIEEVAGREAAIALALAFGGQNIHIPRAENLGVSHRLATALGPAAEAVCGRFAGERIYIPKARRALTRHLALRGLDASEISLRLGISKSAARRYKRGTMVP